MLKTALLSTLLLAGAAAPAMADCHAGDVTITQAALKDVVADGSLSDVRVAVTVRNGGSAKQSGNTLQSVAIYQAAMKTGSKGIPPLDPGQAYTFVYTFQRSPEAAPRTTALTFRLVGDNPAGAMCIAANQRYRLRV